MSVFFVSLFGGVKSICQTKMYNILLTNLKIDVIIVLSTKEVSYDSLQIEIQWQCVQYQA